jgi:UDP-4-amino-4,6-dideoxy-N-acetyl-beta-L-altrosamine transaminase
VIPYGHQSITEADVKAVVKVLRADRLTQGPEIPAFEQAVAARVGAGHAVAVNSATSALHIACLALDLGPGDRLWTVPTTFVASANCGRYCGAEVDFVDIDSVTWNMSVSRLEEKLAAARKDDRLPKVVVPVHFTGQPTRQEAIWELAQEYGFRVLEDATHSIGASRHSEPVGSCRWSHVAVFSFHPVKVITTGEGGMALTNDAELDARMRMLRHHGITRDPSKFRGPDHPTAEASASGNRSVTWYYEQQLLGFNHHMTDLEAALGASQLVRLDEYVERRNELAHRYDQALADLPLRLPTVRPENRSAFHLYVTRLEGTVTGTTRARVIDHLGSQGIEASVHYLPVHLQPYYRDLGFAPGRYPEAEAHGETAITLPLYPALTEAEQDRVVDAVTAALSC